MKKKNGLLALHGGEPVRETYLPYGKQWINDDDMNAVMNVLKSDYITTGPTIKRFEDAVADFVGAKYAVAFSSGTAALHAACYAAGIEQDDEVITSPMTFAATSNCVLYVGGTPVFADIDPNTYTISPASIKPLMTAKTKAIISVDYTGRPAAYDEIMSLAKQNGLTVIGDAAHSLGAVYKENYVGSICDMTMFSFHPVKHITTGEGGMITTNNQRYYEKLIQFRSHGITRDPQKLGKTEGPWYYEMQELGFNYRMTDIQAALGLNQLRKVNQFIEKRRKYVDLYYKGFQGVPEITVPYRQGNCSSSWHLFVIRLNLEKLTAGRKEIFAALQKENIGVNVHYIPVYFHPYYQRIGYNKGICPVSEKLYEEIITLPLFPAMTGNDVMDVVNAVKKVISHYSE
ncbi:UDP-4-amino-4,6-dideoxy-N-acetyl-beta-L-altrosamine transaminase [Virgibacillus ihumii]|uniref:UDP-4-amino-4, 6-dideoxy-N-acetyl-beta-L-altrosamine transaminase n=1 Tax=Virgibacillus ihumii TaxID=2686091 RepID=UPI00157CD764|nr:UDP-4-amino-4,6-dideoxy-N-acetyl-beta-L-altrosamine transaminase [Virgibacillus ihumii]